MGAVINDAVVDPDSIILKPVGDPVNPTLVVDRLPAYVTFVTYEVSLNFTPLFAAYAAP